MRAAVLALVVTAGCYDQAMSRAVPVAVVNDPCAANDTAAACALVGGCAWRAVQSDCPAGATCPEGVCATPDPCAALADQTACQADTRCAWTGLRDAAQSIDVCPAGQTCDAGGYCHTRDASGGGCTCVQPIVCPASADCPTVQCDCSNPTPGNSGGAGTCTCACPVCAPGEVCPPCSCSCSSVPATCGGATGASSGARTCTCACPACPAGTSCPACDCACGAGNVGVTQSAVPVPPTPADVAADPCAHFTDAATCIADTMNTCHWIAVGIACVTAPCPTGACAQLKPASGGCGCACPACAADQTCPPCACECCGNAAGLPPVPVSS
ncbi:MAG TPA: hypothetical protein VN903_26120 [Polyangia bacterium]|nr:hypothetical protein [Polyangia bacterium]